MHTDTHVYISDKASPLGVVAVLLRIPTHTRTRTHTHTSYTHPYAHTHTHTLWQQGLVIWYC